MNDWFCIWSDLQELVDRLDEEMEMNSEISASKRKLEVEIEQMKDERDEMKHQFDTVRLYYLYHSSICVVICSWNMKKHRKRKSVYH